MLHACSIDLARRALHICRMHARSTSATVAVPLLTLAHCVRVGAVRRLFALCWTSWPHSFGSSRAQ